MRLLPVLCVLSLVWTPWVWGQEPEAAPAGGEAASGAAGQEEAALPGSYELVPRALRLADEATTAREEIAELAEVKRMALAVSALEQQAKVLKERVAAPAASRAYLGDRLTVLDRDAQHLHRRLVSLLERTSERSRQLSSLRATWDEHRRFWRRWREDLQGDPQYPALRDEIRRTLGRIETVIAAADAAASEVLPLQLRVQGLLEQEQAAQRRVEEQIAEWRRGLLEAGEPVLFSSPHLHQLGGELWRETGRRVRDGLRMEASFFAAERWRIALQLLVALAVAAAVRMLRRVARDKTVLPLRHPGAVGVLTSVVTVAGGYELAPPLWRLGEWAILTGSTCLVARAVFRNQRKRRVLYLLAGFFFLSQACEASALPSALYRLLLVGFCALAVPLFLVLARREVADRGHTPFAVALRIGAGAVGLVLLAQLLGYHALSGWLITNSVSTAFIVLVVTFLIRLGRGAISLLVGSRWARRVRLVARVGPELARRLSRLLKAILLVMGGLAVLDLWGVVDTAWQAWSGLVGAGIEVGGLKVTVGAVLLALAALYAATLTSWLLRALLDEEVFQHHGIDRGSGDAIKTLLHYAVILAGFLLALTLAGVEVGRLAILAGAFGIGIGFGLQDIVNNFISGLILLFERPVRVGDVVEMDGRWGEIRKIGLRSTVVETYDRSEVIVPNGELISKSVTNWTLSTTINRLVLSVGVAYGSDLEKVFHILDAVPGEHPRVLDDPAPYAVFAGFGDSSLDFEVRAWVGSIDDRLPVKSQLLSEIDRRFRAEGVEIPFPQRDLHLRSVDSEAGQRLGSGRGKGVAREAPAPEVRSGAGDGDGESGPGPEPTPDPGA